MITITNHPKIPISSHATRINDVHYQHLPATPSSSCAASAWSFSAATRRLLAERNAEIVLEIDMQPPRKGDLQSCGCDQQKEDITIRVGMSRIYQLQLVGRVGFGLPGSSCLALPATVTEHQHPSTGIGRTPLDPLVHWAEEERDIINLIPTWLIMVNHG